jgi:hypothetical protein
MWWTFTIHVLVSTFGHSFHCRLLVVVDGAKSLLLDDDDDNDLWQASSSLLSCTIIIVVVTLEEMVDQGIHLDNGIVDHRFYDSQAS